MEILGVDKWLICSYNETFSNQAKSHYLQSALALTHQGISKQAQLSEDCNFILVLPIQTGILSVVKNILVLFWFPWLVQPRWGCFWSSPFLQVKWTWNRWMLAAGGENRTELLYSGDALITNRSILLCRGLKNIVIAINSKHCSPK